MRPAARNSMWRFGFGTPINYSDNEVFCGGVGSKYLLVKVSNSLQMLDFFGEQNFAQFQSNSNPQIMVDVVFAETIGQKNVQGKMKMVVNMEPELFPR